MYFVDATMIRKVDQNGIISTLLGANDLTAVRPLSCDSSMDVSQVSMSTAHVINYLQSETGTWMVHLITKSTSLYLKSSKQTLKAKHADMQVLIMSSRLAKPSSEAQKMMQEKSLVNLKDSFQL